MKMDEMRRALEKWKKLAEAERVTLGAMVWDILNAWERSDKLLRSELQYTQMLLARLEKDCDKLYYSNPTPIPLRKEGPNE
jgi:hypothetical protein